MIKFHCIGKAIYNGKIMFEAESEELNDCDVTWYVEEGITSKPDLTDKKLELHEKGSCCRNFERIIYSVFKRDFTGRGAQESHHGYCAWCGHKFSGDLKHAINKELLGDTVIYFGKHKGLRLSQVPKDYLNWCAENLSDQRLVEKIKVYLSEQAGK